MAFPKGRPRCDTANWLRRILTEFLRILPLASSDSETLAVWHRGCWKTFVDVEPVYWRDDSSQMCRGCFSRRSCHFLTTVKSSPTFSIQPSETREQSFRMECVILLAMQSSDLWLSGQSSSSAPIHRLWLCHWNDCAADLPILVVAVINFCCFEHSHCGCNPSGPTPFWFEFILNISKFFKIISESLLIHRGTVYFHHRIV